MQEGGNSLSYLTYMYDVGTSYQLTMMPELLPNLRYRLLGYGTFCSKVR